MSSHAVSVHLARAPRARPSRSPQAGTRALRATTRRLRPPRARAARQSTALASTPGPARASGDGTRVFAPPLSVYPIPDKEWSAPGADDGELEVEPWEAQPSPFAPAPTPEYAPSRPSEFDPRDERPKPPPLRRRREIPCVLTSRDRTRRRCPLPSFPTPSSAPLASLPRLRLPPAPDPSWSRRNRPLTQNPPHRMSPTRPSSDRPHPKSPARWTRVRRESRGAPADSQESRRE